MEKTYPSADGDKAPPVEPPPELRPQITRPSPATWPRAQVSSFSHLIPYAVAASLMFLGLLQAMRVRDLTAQLSTACEDAAHLQASNALTDLRVAELDVKDPAYASAKIIVAWDPNRAQGVVTLQNLPPPPTGHDYQLWVLDPGALAPINAGVVATTRRFSVSHVGSSGPGFALSLEPAGGSAEPTGPVLFAVAPGA